MSKYLGEKTFPIEETPHKGYTEKDWALYFIERYGQYDGGHHKQWTLDQIVRVLKGTPVIIVQASWDNGQKEWRVATGKPSKEYKKWVKDMCKGEDGPNTYEYDEGIAP